MTLSFGDSPAVHSPKAAAQRTGMMERAAELDIPLADFVKGQDVFFEKGLQNKKFHVANGVLDADKIVSLPKMKSHGLARMTGAVKNQFGCIPGTLKGEMHVKLPHVDDFSRMLVDLNNYVSPSLYVMDAIHAMEGNGPRSGVPKAMNALLISTDPVALDATAARMVNMNPEYVSTTRIGMEVGMGTLLEEEIEIVGDPISGFVRDEFEVVRKPADNVNTGALRNIINALVVPKPFIIPDKCVKCGVCVTICPVKGKAVNWQGDGRSKPPVYEYSKCIRCYCCQEMCPESAIEIKRPFLRKLIDRRM